MTSAQARHSAVDSHDRERSGIQFQERHFEAAQGAGNPEQKQGRIWIAPRIHEGVRTSTSEKLTLKLQACWIAVGGRARRVHWIADGNHGGLAEYARGFQGLERLETQDERNLCRAHAGSAGRFATDPDLRADAAATLRHAARFEHHRAPSARQHCAHENSRSRNRALASEPGDDDVSHGQS